MKKYCVHPGYVYSQIDGNSSYVDERQLMKLYGVHPNDCIVIRNWKSYQGYSEEFLNTLIHLHPRSNGNYEKPR